MDNPFNKKVIAIAFGIFFILAILMEFWQRYTGYIISDKPLLYRLFVQPGVASLGISIVYWVWPRKKKKSNNNMSKNRDINNNELGIFNLVKKVYGDANKVEDIFFSDRNEAIITAKNNKGDMVMMVNLTFLGDLKKSENLADEDIINEWLKIPS